MRFEQVLNSKALCVTDKYILSYKLGCIYFSSLNGNVIQKKRISGGLSRLGLIERLMRLGPRCAIPIDEDHILISLNGTILNYQISSNDYQNEHQFDRGMKNPLTFCSYVNNYGKEEIIYGEYIWNENKGPVAIFKRMDGMWEKLYEFPHNTITHIHNIVYDKYRNQFLILTGDEDAESGIWSATIDFKNVKPIMLGSQKYRACVAFPMTDYILYATDTPLEKNHLNKIDLRNTDEPRLETICELPGPCIYGTQLDEKCYLSTTVEPDSSLPKWQYRLTRKLGKGVKDRYSYLYEIDEENGVRTIASFKKDVCPIWLFQFGNILFPYNTTGNLYFTTQSIKPKNGVTLREQRN